MTTYAIATAAQVRAHYKAEGYEVRIGRDGRVRYRPDPDYHPGCASEWLEGRFVSEYRIVDGNVWLR